MKHLHNGFQRIKIVISLDLIDVVEGLGTFDIAIWISEVNSAN